MIRRDISPYVWRKMCLPYQLAHQVCFLSQGICSRRGDEVEANFTLSLCHSPCRTSAKEAAPMCPSLESRMYNLKCFVYSAEGVMRSPREMLGGLVVVDYPFCTSAQHVRGAQKNLAKNKETMFYGISCYQFQERATNSTYVEKP